jgi:hypothetical protein
MRFLFETAGRRWGSAYGSFVFIRNEAAFADNRNSFNPYHFEGVRL